MEGDAARISDNTAAERYEAAVDGAAAGFLAYRNRDGRRVLVHTEVEPAFEGRGVGSELVAAALDDARSSGRKVVPLCPFVSAYLRRHPEYADVVAA